MKRVRIVHRDIQDDTPSSFRSVEAPSLQSRRKINRMKDPSGQRFANRPFLDESAQSTGSHRIPKMMVGAEDDVRLFAGFEHFTRVLNGQRQRFFTEHMLSRLGS